jgi:hypothetical protein
MTQNPNGTNEHHDPSSHPLDPNDTLMNLNMQESGCSANLFTARNFAEYTKRRRTFRKLKIGKVLELFIVGQKFQIGTFGAGTFGLQAKSSKGTFSLETNTRN